MMPSTIQVGTVLIDDSPLLKQVFDLKSEACSGTRSMVKLQDGVALDRTIHAAGWNFFFMAAEVRAMFFGTLGAKKIHKALTRILKKVRQQHFNGLEVTGIDLKHFLGRALHCSFGKLAPYPTELPTGWRRGTGERSSATQNGLEVECLRSKE
jgi:hypothetical protein